MMPDDVVRYAHLCFFAAWGFEGMTFLGVGWSILDTNGQEAVLSISF